MVNVSLWTYAGLLLCVGIATSQRCPHENPSGGFRNLPPKLNLKSFLGSRLVQRIADGYENVAYTPYDPPNEQPMPLPSSFMRRMPSYDYENERMPAPVPVPAPAPAPAPVPVPAPLPVPPPPASFAPVRHPALNPPRIRDDIYQETIPSSARCPSCEACSQYHDNDQDYEDYPCPCSRQQNSAYYEEECPCSCGGVCPCCSGGGCSQGSDRDYPNDVEPDYNYYTEDCPCNGDCQCGCSGDQDCPCNYPHEPNNSSPKMRGPPMYRDYYPSNQEEIRSPQHSNNIDYQNTDEMYVDRAPSPPMQVPREMPPQRLTPMQMSQIPQMSQMPQMPQIPQMPVNEVPQPMEMPTESNRVVMQGPPIPSPPRMAQPPRIPMRMPVPHTLSYSIRRPSEMPAPPQMNQPEMRINEWRPVARHMPFSEPPEYGEPQEPQLPPPSHPMPSYSRPVYRDMPGHRPRKFGADGRMRSQFFETLSLGEGC